MALRLIVFLTSFRFLDGQFGVETDATRVHGMQFEDVDREMSLLVGCLAAQVFSVAKDLRKD